MSNKKRKVTLVTGYDRSAGGLQKAARAYTQLKMSSFTPKRELGYVDTASAAEFSTTGTITLLNTVPQGAGVEQRVGKKIALKGLQCRGQMTNKSTAVTNDIALMIVYDKRPTGSLPHISDILEAVSASALNNDNNSGRFKILKRIDELLLGNGTNLTDMTAKGCDWWLDLKGLPTVYKALGTGAIADIEDGALYLVCVGDTATGTAAASLVANFRVRFLDV